MKDPDDGGLMPKCPLWIRFHAEQIGIFLAFICGAGFVALNIIFPVVRWEEIRDDGPGNFDFNGLLNMALIPRLAQATCHCACFMSLGGGFVSWFSEQGTLPFMLWITTPVFLVCFVIWKFTVKLG